MDQKYTCRRCYYFFHFLTYYQSERLFFHSPRINLVVLLRMQLLAPVAKQIQLFKSWLSLVNR
ncbi:hypothetical protein MKX03_014488, partial [Papaver bracteatum]